MLKLLFNVRLESCFRRILCRSPPALVPHRGPRRVRPVPAARPDGLAAARPAAVRRSEGNGITRPTTAAFNPILRHLPVRSCPMCRAYTSAGRPVGGPSDPHGMRRPRTGPGPPDPVPSDRTTGPPARRRGTRARAGSGRPRASGPDGSGDGCGPRHPAERPRRPLHRPVGSGRGRETGRRNEGIRRTDWSPARRRNDDGGSVLGAPVEGSHGRNGRRPR